MRNLLKMFLFTLAFGVMTQVSQAALIYSCAGTATQCNGNEYAVFEVSHVGNVYTWQVDIKVTNSYTGNHWADNVVAIALSGLPTFTGGSLVSDPSGAWTFVTNELTANGCNGGGSNSLCAEANTFADGANVTGAGTILSWQFQFTSTTSPIETVHLKYLYASGGNSTNYNKADNTDLGSYDIHVQDGPQGDEPGVPEPATYALMGSAAIALGLWKRKMA